MSKKQNAKQAAAEKKLAQISAKAEGITMVEGMTVAAAPKAVSAPKQGYSDEHYDVYALQPVDAKLNLLPELVDVKRRADRPVFSNEESAKMVADLRAMDKFTQVKRWKSGPGFTVWASTRPLDEVRADREIKLGKTIKARHVAKKAVTAEAAAA